MNDSVHEGSFTIHISNYTSMRWLRQEGYVPRDMALREIVKLIEAKRDIDEKFGTTALELAKGNGQFKAYFLKIDDGTLYEVDIRTVNGSGQNGKGSLEGVVSFSKSDVRYDELIALLDDNRAYNRGDA